MDLPLLSAGAVFTAVFAVLLIIILKRKALFVGSVVWSLAILALAAFCFAASFGVIGKAEEMPVSEDQSENDAYFASVLLANGRADEAIVLMEKSVGRFEDPAGILLLARLNAVAGNSADAYLYYAKYERINGGSLPQEISDEKNYAANLLNASAIRNGAIREYYEKTGTEPENAAPLPTSLAPNSFIKNVKNRIDASVEVRAQRLKEAGEAVALSAAIGSNDDEELSDEKLEEVKIAAEKLNRIIKTDDALKTNRAVREAALNLNCRLGDSAAVAENLGEYSVDRELEVAAELISAGYITPADMKGVRRPYTDAQLEKVRERCREVYGASSGELDPQKRQEYKELLDAIESSASDYAPSAVLGWLTEAARNSKCGDISKAFLEAAKGYTALGLSKKASECVDSALETAASSPDGDYSGMMGAIRSVITGEDTENVIRVSEYVNAALELAAPVDTSTMTPSSSVKPPEQQTGQDAASGLGAPVAEEITRTIEKKRTVINIGRIDTGEFAKVSFTVSFGDGAGITEKNFKSLVSVSDCGYYITDYKVEKLDDLKGRIILLCDISGSMAGKENDLRAAVEGFADGMGKDEMIAVAGFSGGIVFRSDFLSSSGEVKEYASKLRPGGGTAILNSMESISTLFSKDFDCDNILIVMTDGQDGGRQSEDRVRERIGQLVAACDCTVYMIGLGSGVDSAYLQIIADEGNGRFVFVEHADGLEAFYSFIHRQLSNRYLVTFTAKEKLQNERKLEIVLNGAVGSAEKTYFLRDPSEADADDYAEAMESFDGDELMLFGLDKSIVCRTSKDVSLKLFGENFKSDGGYTVTLRGNLRPTTLNWTFVSENELALTLPGNLPEGTYTVSVTGKTEKRELENALRIASDNSKRKTVRYGSYVFTCDSAKRTGEGISMSGNVMLNGWLIFEADVDLVGECDDAKSLYVKLETSGGAKIFYNTTGTEGLANYLASKGIGVTVNLPQSLLIYSEKYDSSSYENFPVQEFVFDTPVYLKTFAYVGGTFALYPDMVYSGAFYSEPEFPFFKDVAKNLSHSIFRRNIEGALAFTSNKLCVAGKLELGYDEDNDLNERFSLTKLALNLSALKLEIDTVKNRHKFVMEVGFADLKIVPKKLKVNGGVTFNGVGLELGWKDGRFNSLMFSASGKVTVTETPVPLYLTKVGFGISDGFADVYSLKDLLNLTVTGKFNLSTVDFLELLGSKTIRKIFNKDKLPLAEIDDATLNVCLGKLNINFKADLKVLDIDMGKCEVNLGKFSYTNKCLGLDQTQYGAEVGITLGPEFKFENFEFTLQGTKDLTLGFPCDFISYSGNMHFLITWGLFPFQKDLNGEFTFGYFYNSFKEFQFVIKGVGREDKGSYAGFRVDWSKSAGLDWTLI